MNEDIAAAGLAALGNTTRLKLYKLLIKAGDQGLNVSEIKSLIKVPSSTLAHHLTTLTQSGLIEQKRQGRTIVSSANFPMMNELLAYLADECCTGFCLTLEEEAA
jgi:ArsR family transcriptional regulator, arsenate/arsenite/antimonite-responsive transcriptional repressor